MSRKYPIPKLTEEVQAEVLKEKTEQEQLGIKAHWALNDLSNFFERRRDARFYSTNKLIHQLWDIWIRDDVS